MGVPLTLLPLLLRLELLARLLLSESEEEEDAERRSVLATISATEARCSIPKREGLPRREIICKLFVSQLSFCVGIV